MTNLASPVSSEEVNPPGQGGVHPSLCTMSNQSQTKAWQQPQHPPNPAASVGAKQGLLHTDFPVPKPSSGTVGVPQHGMGQGHPEQPHCLPHLLKLQTFRTCKNKNTDQTFRLTLRSVRFIVGLFLRSMGVTELMGVCQTTLSETLGLCSVL